MSIISINIQQCIDVLPKIVYVQFDYDLVSSHHLELSGESVCMIIYWYFIEKWADQKGLILLNLKQNVTRIILFFYLIKSLHS